AMSPARDRIRVEVDPARLRPHDVPRQVADDSKFRSLTGWKPETSFLDETLPAMLDHWRATCAKSMGA
ncbi:MAG: GDP-mannose 4,6-dehydratase, partial [Chloroflexota bacterium]